METWPSALMPMKRCGLAVDCRALMATPRLPSVPFLKPTAQDRPEASSRWVWDSVVRAPMADQEIRSCRYWGEMGSSASRSEEHTSELQSRPHLVCRLLLEK